MEEVEINEAEVPVNILWFFEKSKNAFRETLKDRRF